MMEPKDAPLPFPPAGDLRLAACEAELATLIAERAHRIQRDRDGYNQAVGFVAGIAWTLAIYYLVRRS